MGLLLVEVEEEAVVERLLDRRLLMFSPQLVEVEEEVLLMVSEPLVGILVELEAPGRMVEFLRVVPAE